MLNGSMDFELADFGHQVLSRVPTSWRIQFDKLSRLAGDKAGRTVL